MLKFALRIILTPACIVLRLMLGIAAFVVSISSSMLSLTISVFVALAMADFLIGYWQNGIVLLVLALLASPIGLPFLANWTLNRISSAFAFIEGLIN